MPQDQRILDIIAASSAKKPADVDSVVDQLIGERIVDLIDQRRAEICESFFAGPDVETLDESDTRPILGRFSPRFGKTQSQMYPHNHFTKYGEDHNRGPLGTPDIGHGFNFTRHKGDIESHPHFHAAVDALRTDEHENNVHGYSLHQEMEHPDVQKIARDLGHSTFQVHDYCSLGPWNRRHGSYGEGD